MKILKLSLLGLLLLGVFFVVPQALAQVGGISIQTNSATNIYNNQAMLNGYVANPIYQSTTYGYFQWGTSTNYGNETTHQFLGSAGSFSQNITGLSPNTTYHFRAVAQTNYGTTVYGQDMTFYTTGSGNYYGQGYLNVSKKVINLTSGNLSWQPSVNAKPGDVLSFVITLQTNGVSVHNINIKDYLPSNLIYNDNLTINASLNYSNDPRNGIYVGTLYAGEIYVISYQAKVASLPYGITTLSNTATVTSQETGTQTASASVIITSSAVSGVTYIPAGITNNPITDSFFVPLLLLILSSWLYFCGHVNKLADWLKTKI